MAHTLFVASVVFVCHLATCFLGFSQAPAPELVSSSEMRVIARADNAKIDCKVKQLKNGVARVELRSEFDVNKLSNDRDLKKVTWFIDYEGNEYRDSNRFVLTR